MPDPDDSQPGKRRPGRPKVTDKEPHSTIVIRLPTALLELAKAAAGDRTVAAFVRQAIEITARSELRKRGKP